MGLLFLVFTSLGYSQILDPVKWKTSVEKVSPTEFDLIVTATIERGWHLYSQNVPDDGPIPTTFSFEGSVNYLKKGNTKEEVGHTVNDPVFNMKIKYFDKKATFKQRIKIKYSDAFKINASVEFMVCNDTQCLPPTEIDLTFSIP